MPSLTLADAASRSRSMASPKRWKPKVVEPPTSDKQRKIDRATAREESHAVAPARTGFRKRSLYARKD